MSYRGDYEVVEPARMDVDAAPGLVLLEFGAPWCGHCQAAQPALRDMLDGPANVIHLKVEDGRGKPLGRAFGVKLWPTLVLLRAGDEIARVVRPVSGEDLVPLAEALGAR
ncbi:MULTISPECIES: thioredoxin family protein [unclassified Luteimonas]